MKYILVFLLAGFIYAEQYVIVLETATNKQRSSFTLPDGEELPLVKDCVVLTVSQAEYAELSHPHEWDKKTQDWLKIKEKSDLVNAEKAKVLAAEKEKADIQIILEEMAKAELQKEIIK